MRTGGPDTSSSRLAPRYSLPHQSSCGGQHPPVPTSDPAPRAPQSCRGTQSQSQAREKEGAKGFIDKYADISVHRDCCGAMTGCRPPLRGLQPGDGPGQTPAQQPSCPATCLISANCAGGRERERLASGSLPLGLMSGPLPSRTLALCPGQRQGQGQGRETAAASDPEQKPE